MSISIMLILIYILIATVLIAFFGIQLFSLISIILYMPKKLSEPTDYPKVSILLAARNEEKLIERSLESINKLNYPKDKIEILIGNDASTDRTKFLIEKFISNKPEFTLYHIDKTIGKGRGKANVLGQLAHHASGEFYFITDVDVKVPENWVLDLLNEFEDNVGIVSGTTMCDRGGIFATLQGMDWLHFMGYIKAFANAGIGCTSVGNNMAVRAKAYWETGGYEKIDFSITEDYKLFKEVTSRGWDWRTNLSKDCLGLAWYIPSVKEMLHQRKRWLIGAKELPLNWKSMIILYGLFIPALFTLFFIDYKLAMLFWGAKFLIQSIFIYSLNIKSETRPFSFWQMLIYELYVLLNTVITAFFYILPIKSVWKGREYNEDYLKDSVDTNVTE